MTESGPAPLETSLPSLAVVIEEATRARQFAYAPYSHFRVGAAIMTSDGHIIRGANVENASYGLSTCAERVALWSATSVGERNIVAVVIVADTAAPISPCGACRQVLRELAPNAAVVMATVSGIVTRSTVAELLPLAFDSKDIAPT